MTALTLLEQVVAAGVQIRVVGADLAIQPKGTLPCELRAQLASNKPQVRALPDPETRWRVEIMNPQVPPWPTPVLGAREAQHAARPPAPRPNRLSALSAGSMSWYYGASLADVPPQDTPGMCRFDGMGFRLRSHQGA